MHIFYSLQSKKYEKRTLISNQTSVSEQLFSETISLSITIKLEKLKQNGRSCRGSVRVIGITLYSLFRLCKKVKVIYISYEKGDIGLVNCLQQPIPNLNFVIEKVKQPLTLRLESLFVLSKRTSPIPKLLGAVLLEVEKCQMANSTKTLRCKYKPLKRSYTLKTPAHEWTTITIRIGVTILLKSKISQRSKQQIVCNIRTLPIGQSKLET